MSGNVLEYVIKATDATGKAVSSAMGRVRKFASSVTQSMGAVKNALSVGDVEERFVRTGEILDRVGLALDRLGVSGQDFNDVYDTLKTRLDAFNRTGEGFEGVLQHFRASMADIGMDAKNIERGVQVLKSGLTGFGTTGKAASADVRRGFRALHAAVGALNGNVYSLGQAFVGLLGSIKKLKISAAALTGISLAVYAITEVLAKCVNWWREKKRRMEEIQNLRFENTLKKYAEAQSEANRELTKYERQLTYETERKKKLIDQNAKLIEQELELARVKALSGTSGEQRDAVNRDYDAQVAMLRAKTAIEKAQLDVTSGVDLAAFITKMEAKLAPEKAKIEKQLAALDAEVKKSEDAKRSELAKSLVWEARGPATVYGQAMTARHKTEDEKSREFEEWTLSDEDYKRLTERRARLKEQLDGIVSDLEDFKDRRQRAVDKANDAKVEIKQIEQDDELDAWREWEDAMREYYDELERLEAEAARQAERDAEAARKAEERRHEERMRNAEDEAKAAQKSVGEAQSRLDAAKAYADKAWGFYRDRDALASHNADVDADIEARKQYEKDREAVTRGKYSDKFRELQRIARDDGMDTVEAQLAEWRRRKSISLDTEATMRVALSENEQKEAMRNLQRAAEAAEAAQSVLEEIAQELQEEA